MSIEKRPTGDDRKGLHDHGCMEAMGHIGRMHIEVAKERAQIMRLRKEGIGRGRDGSMSSRTRRAFGWPRLAKVPFQGLHSAVALVVCACTRDSEPLAHDEWEAVCPIIKDISCVQRMGGITTAGTTSEFEGLLQRWYQCRTYWATIHEPQESWQGHC